MVNEMRDRLADLLKKADKNCERKCITDYEDAILDNADYLIENGVVVSQWISVNDRLPEDKQKVLAIDSESKMEVCFYEKKWNGVFQQCGGLVKIFNITHWMPLPESPKSEQKLKKMRGDES